MMLRVLAMVRPTECGYECQLPHLAERNDMGYE